jgi:hypothetical protein
MIDASLSLALTSKSPESADSSSYPFAYQRAVELVLKAPSLPFESSDCFHPRLR